MNPKTIFLAVVVANSCLTHLQPIDCSLPGSSVHGISQPRILKWVAMSSPGDLPDPGIKHVSCNTGRFFYYFFFFTAEPFGKLKNYFRVSFFQCFLSMSFVINSLTKYHAWVIQRRKNISCRWVSYLCVFLFLSYLQE